jgi:hypothetical protein
LSYTVHPHAYGNAQTTGGAARTVQGLTPSSARAIHFPGCHRDIWRDT